MDGITTGCAFIKVGFFDTGVNWDHEELSVDMTFGTGSVIGGADYATADGTDISSNPHNDLSGHGTGVLGVAGAKRDNEVGIAGVAGGDSLNAFNTTSMIAYKIFLNDGNAPYVNDADSAYYAYFDDIFFLWQQTASSGNIDVYNNSWGHTGAGIPDEWDLWEILATTITDMVQYGAVIVAAMGHWNDAVPLYPAITRRDNFTTTQYLTGQPETFVISVGGSNSDAERWGESSYHHDMDLLAPASSDLVYTLKSDTTNGFEIDEYDNKQGNSFAAPHVSGVAALMLGYINVFHNMSEFEDDAPNDLSCEDVEILMEKFAADFDTTNHPDYLIGDDLYTGAGLLDAANVLEHIQLPQYRVWHFDASGGEVEIEQLDDMILGFHKQYQIEGAGTNTILPSAYYMCEVYELTGTNNHDVMNAEYLDSWPRNSGSNVYGIRSGPDPYDRLFQFPDVRMVECDEDHAVVKGNLFKILYNYETNQEVNMWYPFHPDSIPATLAYTVYTEGGTLAVENPAELPDEVTLYPNPAHQQIVVQCPVHSAGRLAITITDMTGRVIMKEENMVASPALHSFVLDVGELSNGVYLCLVESSTNFSSVKFVKQ